jgi:L,D-transpeptidase YbiS
MSDKGKIFTLSVLTLFTIIVGLGYYIGLSKGFRSTPVSENTQVSQGIKKLKSRNLYLKNKIEGLAPKGTYIVIDSAANRLYLYRGNRKIHEAVVSCGSGSVLKDRKGKRQWIFDTPRGVFSVQSKFISPVWTKPDWAFIEEGAPIPATAEERIEKGVLGDYSLGFGNGYFIHGTLYTRLLGRNVTHGCIRVGDEDLRKVFTTAGIGTKIIIF